MSLITDLLEEFSPFMLDHRKRALRSIQILFLLTQLCLVDSLMAHSKKASRDLPTSPKSTLRHLVVSWRMPTAIRVTHHPIPPQSSPVQEMEICCPNIPAEDFDYLLFVPRTMKVFRWTGKAWTCHRSLDDDNDDDDDDDDDDGDGDDDGGGGDDDGGGGDDDDDESLEDGRLEDVKCETISVESTVSSLRHARLHLEELTIEYAFVGTCPHSNTRPGNLNDFVQLKKLKVSPQVLHGFHRCASPETCLEDCSHLRNGNKVIAHLPPRMQHLGFWMQGNGDTLANTIAQIVRFRSLPLVQILLYSAQVNNCAKIYYYIKANAFWIPLADC